MAVLGGCLVMLVLICLCSAMFEVMSDGAKSGFRAAGRKRAFGGKSYRRRSFKR